MNYELGDKRPEIRSFITAKQFAWHKDEGQFALCGRDAEIDYARNPMIIRADVTSVGSVTLGMKPNEDEMEPAQDAVSFTVHGSVKDPVLIMAIADGVRNLRISDNRKIQSAASGDLAKEIVLAPKQFDPKSSTLQEFYTDCLPILLRRSVYDLYTLSTLQAVKIQRSKSPLFWDVEFVTVGNQENLGAMTSHSTNRRYFNYVPRQPHSFIGNGQNFEVASRTYGIRDGRILMTSDGIKLPDTPSLLRTFYKYIKVPKAFQNHPIEQPYVIPDPSKSVEIFRDDNVRNNFDDKTFAVVDLHAMLGNQRIKN